MAKVIDISNRGRLRNGEMEGIPLKLPTVGEIFWMLGKPITEGADGRMFNTSMVKEVDEVAPGVFEFKTASGSVYRLITD